MDLCAFCTLKPLADGAVLYLQATSAVSKEAKSKVAAVPGQQGIWACIRVVCCSEIPKLGLGGDVGYVWNEDRMTMFIAEIPHSNSCQLHYCQINSELLPIIHCLAWRQWNGGFASMAEIRVAQPSEEPCKVAKEMSNVIWSESISKVLQGRVQGGYTFISTRYMKQRELFI